MTNGSLSNLLGSFIWYDQMSNDMSGAEAFYTKVVGWTPGPNTMNAQRYTLLQAGGTAIGGLMPIPEEAAKMGVPPCWTGYVAVDDVKAYADKVKAAGGTIMRPPADIPNIGTFSVVLDPTGAGFILFRGTSPEAPAHDASAPGHVGWRELHAGDGDKAFDFYSGLFGWQSMQEMPMGPMGIYRIYGDGTTAWGGIMTKPEEMPASRWNFYITVDSVEGAAERIKARGGQVLMEPMQVPDNSFVIHAADPQGAAFSLRSLKR